MSESTIIASKCQVRQANIWDATAITRLWAKMRLEVDPKDKGRTEIFYIKTVNRIPQKNWIFLVAEDDKKVIGFIMGEIQLPMYGNEYIGFGESFYIEPEYRNKGIGRKLHEGLIEFFKSNGLQEMQMNTVYSTSLVKSWQRKGYEPVFITFRKDLGND